MKQPTLYMWQKKGQMTTSKKVISMVNHKNKGTKKQVWVKKEESNPKSQDQQVKLSQQIRNIPSKEMQLRIAKLQVLLFGMTSIKGITDPSATNCHLIQVK